MRWRLLWGLGSRVEGGGGAGRLTSRGERAAVIAMLCLCVRFYPFPLIRGCNIAGMRRGI